ncbi:hypothetical protein [Nisaea sediminum]|uniref:hypothetical protein n=1 Tax=Nisaea sediminum TaxID=2775867 RepID=UPI001868CDEB|nr:hypothetical protein [Nisaea sediminum]
MISTLGVYAQGLLPQLFEAQNADTPDRKASLSQRPASGTGIVDTVEISAEARALLKTQQAEDALFQARVDYFEQFRPTREGFSARNLSAGIVDPSAEPFSQERSFAQVAEAARQNLDSKYEAMRESGEPFSTHNYEGVDHYSLFGELDRRALHAVASNEGGLFSEDEQNTARDLMNGQQGMAMGLYNGPTRLSGEFLAASPLDHESTYKAGLQFLDKVSIEEKATRIEWAVQRAVIQRAYESEVSERGGIPERFAIDHPVVALISAAMEAWEHNPGLKNTAQHRNAAELRSQEWFAPFADRLDAAIAETLKMYGLATS